MKKFILNFHEKDCIVNDIRESRALPRVGDKIKYKNSPLVTVVGVVWRFDKHEKGFRHVDIEIKEST